MAFNYRTQYQSYRRYFSDFSHVYQTKPEVKLYLELTLTLFTISFFTVFAIRPTALTIINLYKDIESQKIVNQQLDQKIAALNLAQNNYQKYQADLSILDLILPTRPLPSLLLSQVESLIASHALSLSSLSLDNIYLIGSPSRSPTSENLPTLPASTESVNFTISVQGDYANLKAFLQDMENLQRINLITNIHFTSPQSSDETPSTSLVLNISGQLPFTNTNQTNTPVSPETNKQPIPNSQTTTP